MTERPVVVVWRAANADHLPGIEAAGTVADIRFAPDVSALRPALDQAEVLFFHHGSKPELEAAWPLATKLRWIQSASDGVDGLLSPRSSRATSRSRTGGASSTTRSPNG
jgi:phosphoglycerate dehydrogenase-like enzyme